MRIFYILLFCITLNTNSYAGLEKLINTITPKGTMSNASNTVIVNEQEAGHILGGSISVSSPALQDLHLFNMESPSCKFGGSPCDTSLDFNAGGLSFAKGPALSNFIKQLANQAQTYGAILAIQTMCPQCENIMTWLQEAVQAVNAMAIPACKSMEMIAGGMQTVANATSDAVAQVALISRGENDDMVSLQKKSKSPRDESTGNLPELKTLLGDNFNLVWKALDERSGENELKEFLMSLSGTVIARKEKGMRSFTYKRGLIDEEKLSVFMGANKQNSQILIYRCDSKDKCLNPKTYLHNINQSNTFKSKIVEILTSIIKKVASDGNSDLTSEEKTLVALSSTQLMNKIEQDFAEYGGNLMSVIIAQEETIDVLCYDIITKYLAQILSEVREAVSELKYSQLGDVGAFKSFEKEAARVLHNLTKAKENAYNRHNVIVNHQDRILQRGKYQREIIYKRIMK